METEQSSTDLTWYQYQCPTCLGRGCNWCRGEVLLVPGRDGNHVCGWHQQITDYDGTTIGVDCHQLAEVALRVAVMDEFDLAVAHVDMQYACANHVSELVTEIVEDEGRIIDVKLSGTGFVVQGEPYSEGAEQMGCPFCLIEAGTDRAEAFAMPEDALPQRDVVRGFVTLGSDPTQLWELTCGHTVGFG